MTVFRTQIALLRTEHLVSSCNDDDGGVVLSGTVISDHHASGDHHWVREQRAAALPQTHPKPSSPTHWGDSPTRLENESSGTVDARSADLGF
ncbi:hypothetical protein VTN00DRAFT_4254 [Thermoascus crustaceus]|uniref:uncharacterized protein n=1 Tax=Thermoascus crustaceus TaxID=5088 RepID=UPI00374279FA